MEQKQARPLSSVKAGQTAKLASINAGHGLKSRLTLVGLVSDVEIKVLSNQLPGPFLINVRDLEMMLSRGVTRKTMVLRNLAINV